jgi:hypothetical protein
MQKFYYVFRIILFLTSIAYLTSCSSSSYYERYGKYESEDSSQKDRISRFNSNSEPVEDELELVPSPVSYNEAEEILTKLNGVTGTNGKKKKFLNEIVSYLNTPYRYGGESRSGIDCSAFTQKVFQNSLKVNLPRTAREQYRRWEIFKEKGELKFGDLVYFNTSRRYYPGHVGIYLDNDLFAHASSSRGVIVSSLNNIYYSSKFIGANRVRIKQ